MLSPGTTLGPLYEAACQTTPMVVAARHSIQAARTVLEHTKDADELNINVTGTVTQVAPRCWKP